MLSFYMPVGPAIAAAADEPATIAAIDAGFNPFPGLPAVAPYAISVGDLALTLAADSNSVFNPAACSGIMDSVFLTVPTGELVTRNIVEDLPGHFRRVISELVGTATGLSVAKLQGYGLFATIAEINDILGLPETVQRIWDGNGPDYLLCDPATYDLRLLECKGTSLSPAWKPKSFSSYKAQSLNAQLIPPFTVNARLLSYAVVRPGEELVCRQFNHRQIEPQHRNEPRIVVAVAFIHFTTLLRKTQYVWIAQRLKAQLNLLAVEEQVQPPGQPREIEEGFLVERNASGQATLAIDLAAEALFARIAEENWMNNDAVARELAGQISILSRSEGQLRQRALALDWQLDRIATSAVGILLYQY